MSAPNCLRSLARPSAGIQGIHGIQGIPVSAPRTAASASTALALARTRTAPFSTTAANARLPIKKDPKPQQGKGHNRAGKKLVLSKFKKDKVAEKGRPPQPGERKAYRKRITLSNDNAIPVPWLTDLTAADLTNPDNTAKVLAIPEETQDQLRATEAFKPTQCWGMFRKPAVLVRKETVDLANRMQNSASKKQTLRLVVSGDKVAGKSMMLLQAMTHAYLNNWIVIHVPEAQELTTACTEYAPIPGTDPVQYMQPVYVLKLIQTIKRANEKVLSKITTMSAHPELSQNVPANTSLLTLCNVAKEPDAAWPVFQALWNELTKGGANRPPILLSLDGLAHVMKMSDYRAPPFDLIHSHDLALVKLFTDVLGGAVQFPGGGAVVAATSRSNAPRSPSMELALAQREAEQQQRAKSEGGTAVEAPKKDPFFRGYDERVEAVLRSVEVLRLQGVDKLEARALMEYWAASGMLRATVDEKAVTEKWTLAGSGILGEMERASLLTMRV